MNVESFKKKLVKYTINLEIVLALCIVIAIALGLMAIIKYIVLIYETGIPEIYDLFKKFLSLSLLLVIGVELVLMLLSHSSSSILELVLFAIARKMLVYSETMMDLIIGTAAIAIVFIIRKYLMLSEKYIDKDGKIVSAASHIHDINFDTGLNIPEDKGVTIGGLICHLSEETCTPVEEGAEYEVGNIVMKILKMREGLIEKVMLCEKQPINNN